jgi:hypothetical protein
MANIKFKSIDQDEVLKLHYEGNCLRDISVRLSTTEYIIKKILELNGLSGINNGTKTDRLKDKYQDIIDSYKKSNKLSVVAREFNISEALVSNVLKLHSIPKRDFVVSPFMGLNQEDVIKEYKKVHIVKIVADKFGVSNTLILKILHFNNVRVSKTKYTDDEIIEKYNELKTIESTSGALGLSYNTVSKILNKHNVERLNLKRIGVGDIFGKLTVVEEVESKVSNGGNKRRQFILECECGEHVKRDSTKLSGGKSWHCGCVITQRKQNKVEKKERITKENLQKKLIKQEEKRLRAAQKPPRKIYRVGDVVERLTILSISDDNYDDRKITIKCECGKISEIKIKNFYGKRSCGCLRKAPTKIIHGHSSKTDPEMRRWYDRWRGMIKRCYNPKMHAYHNYGGRGIRVCDRWLEPKGVGCKNYYDDIHNILGPQPSPEHSLDRIDNDGLYEIANLRWATNSEQTKNQRRNIK